MEGVSHPARVYQSGARSVLFLSRLCSIDLRAESPAAGLSGVTYKGIYRVIHAGRRCEWMAKERGGGVDSGDARRGYITPTGCNRHKMRC